MLWARSFLSIMLDFPALFLGLVSHCQLCLFPTFAFCIFLGNIAIFCILNRSSVLLACVHFLFVAVWRFATSVFMLKTWVLKIGVFACVHHAVWKRSCWLVFCPIRDYKALHELIKLLPCKSLCLPVPKEVTYLIPSLFSPPCMPLPHPLLIEERRRHLPCCWTLLHFSVKLVTNFICFVSCIWVHVTPVIQMRPINTWPCTYYGDSNTFRVVLLLLKLPL